MSQARSEFPGVVQAAGLSRRMGSLGPKLLLPLRGRPLIAHVVDSALASRLAEVVVVLGPEPERFRRALPEDPRLRVVLNARHAEGRSGSIRAGLDALGTGAPGAAFLLGDQPLMSAELIDGVIARAEQEASRGELGSALVVPVLSIDSEPAAGKDAARAKANPVLFRRMLFDDLRRLTGDRGALPLIEANWESAALVVVEDPRTQTRVETPGDYELLLAMAGGA